MKRTPYGPWHHWGFTGLDGLTHLSARCLAPGRPGTARPALDVVTCLWCVAWTAR